MPAEDFRLLKSFLEERPVAVRAAEPLKDGTIFQMNIVGDDASYYVEREAKRTVLKEGTLPRNPDITFTISQAAIKRLHDFDSNNIGAYGVEFFKIMVSDDPELSLDAKLNIGFFKLTRLGVFKILAKGGPEVMSFLATRGLGSLKAIGKAIKKLTGKN